MYDFDMQALLKAFNDDPTQLADAFTKQLNDALTIKRKEEEIKNAANHLAIEWNNFIKEYFAFYYPKDNEENYLFKDGNEIMAFIQVIMQAMPEVEKYLNVINNINEKTEKAKGIINDIINSSATDDFKKTMQDFFDKYGI